MSTKQNHFNTITLPLSTKNLDNLNKYINLQNLKQKLEESNQEIDIEFNGNTHFLGQESDKYIFKVITLQNKKDPSKKIKKLICQGKIDKEYNCDEFKDFHYQTPIEEQQFINTIKYWPQENRPDFLKSNCDPQIFSYMSKPQEFIKTFKHKNVELFKNTKNANNNLKQDKDKVQYKYMSISVMFNNKIPINTLSVPEESIYNKQLYIIIKKMFDKRPMWLRNSIQYYIRDLNIEYTQSDFKKVMSLIAFTYKNGPWKFSYVRFGYDPAQHFDAIDYQVIDIAVQEKDNYVSTDKQLNDFTSINFQNQIYDPTYQEKPTKYRHLYQICDLNDMNIRTFFLKSKEQLQQTNNFELTEKSGWLKLSHLRRIQKIMKEKFRIDNNM